MNIQEVINHGMFPDHLVDKNHIYSYLDGSVVVATVRPSVTLCRNKNVFLLVKNGETVLGCVVLNHPIVINGNEYGSLKVLYVFPEYRKTSATHWLLFSVKEELEQPLIVDGAIFKDGGELILSVLRHQSVRASVIDKHSGRTEPLTMLVDDPDKAYVFEQTRLGYAIDYALSPEPIWLPVFEDKDTI